MGEINEDLHPNACGLRLYWARGDDLRGYELVTFPRGRPAVETILRRAAICGDVTVEGPQGDYFADVYTDPHTWEQTVALDRSSFRYLKDRLRPRVDTGEGQ